MLVLVVMLSWPAVSVETASPAARVTPLMVTWPLITWSQVALEGAVKCVVDWSVDNLIL